MFQSSRDEKAMLEVTQQTIWSVDPTLAILDASTMKEMQSENLGPARLAVMIMFLAAGFGLLLAGLGVYSVVAFSLSQQMHENAVRIALGARRKDLLAIIFRNWAKIVVSGIIIGVFAAFGIKRLIAIAFFQTGRLDFAIFTGTAAGLTLIALASGLLPAWRALRVNPAVILNSP
jgi:putative ABC transport system permease protein